MEDSLENWLSQLDDVLDENHDDDYTFDEQEFLREILEEPEHNLLHEGENPFTIQGCATNSTVSFDGTLHKSNSSNSIKSLKRSTCASPATTCLLSFDNYSTTGPITHEPYSPKVGSAFGSSNKRSMVKDVPEFVEPLVPQPRKKFRRSSQIQHHIIAERNRRQELTRSIITLSAAIPGLKKMDKANVLREAINYTKQLQERVKELENNKKKVIDPAIFIRKSQVSSSKSTHNCEANTESLFEVEANVLDEEVLIGIHCEKQKDIVFKIHAIFEKLHLSITCSSVLPFGTSTLIINIIAQMDDGYSMTMDDLAKKLRECLLEVYDMQQ